MNHSILLSLIVLTSYTSMAQPSSEKSSDLPYYQIPDSPLIYTAPNVAARMVDGLGFRYYWATDGLQPEDLIFKPNEESRTTEETLDHILGLTRILINSVKKEATDFSAEQAVLTFEEKRRLTLANIKETSDILKSSTAEDLKDYNIVFKSGDKVTEYPFWNQLNGPIADAIWHVGQVVSFRRSSGNPFNSKASVLRGKLRD